ncbi:MAG TPA: hypothetical protein VGO37_06110 [Steroidobacteraceae bacterium]|jgi:hypothetical protein|nr:hypothetical protein [Steroidobacteraceae bacterium]
MAKRNSTRRRARKPKFIEVDGRQLSPAEHEIYRQKLAGRAVLIGRAEQEAHTLALSDLDYQKRASSHAAKRVQALGYRGSHVSIALSSLSDFAFYEAGADPKLIELANAVIGHCATELEAVAADVRALHTAIASEVSAEVAHG